MLPSGALGSLQRNDIRISMHFIKCPEYSFLMLGVRDCAVHASVHHSARSVVSLVEQGPLRRTASLVLCASSHRPSL